MPNIGESVQGNPIRAIIIGGSDGGPAVYNQCGIHAREWITHSTCMYMIVELLESPDPLIRRLVDEIRFVFVPNGNPDGYVWSWAPSGSRLWRENRAAPPAGSSCFGVDLNRNFGARNSPSLEFRSIACAKQSHPKLAFRRPLERWPARLLLLQPVLADLPRHRSGVGARDKGHARLRRDDRRHPPVPRRYRL